MSVTEEAPMPLHRLKGRWLLWQPPLFLCRLRYAYPDFLNDIHQRPLPQIAGELDPALPPMACKRAPLTLRLMLCALQAA